MSSCLSVPQNPQSIFIVFAGLPGVGKTTIARALARRLQAVYLRIDSLEHAFASTGVIALDRIGPGGYCAAAAVAADNLSAGMMVIADSVNPLPVTRELWIGAATQAGARHFGIEVVCSDIDEHHHRVRNRVSDIDGFVLPDWQAVVEREYVGWTGADMRVDTAEISPERAVEMIADRLGVLFLIL